jgi:hypothetical protein
MSLREKLIVLADELWQEAHEAAERRSRVEASAKRGAANRIREVLEMEPLS